MKDSPGQAAGGEGGCGRRCRAGAHKRLSPPAANRDRGLKAAAGGEGRGWR